MNTIVWAYRRLPELGGQLRFVECDEELAKRLIASGDVQDPRVGAAFLRDVEDGQATASAAAAPVADSAPPTAQQRQQAYQTRVMEAASARAATRPATKRQQKRKAQA